MPIYEYECRECGHKFDKLQKMSDEPLKVCPACSAESLVKLISGPQFRFAGKGWYETDFKSENQKNLVNSDSGSTKSDTKKSDTKKTDASKTTASSSSSSSSTKEKQ